MEEEQGTQSSVEVWKEVHRQLMLAIVLTKDSISIEKAKRRYLLEEIHLNVGADGRLEINSNWGNKMNKFASKRQKKSKAKNLVKVRNRPPRKEEFLPGMKTLLKKNRSETPPVQNENGEPDISQSSEDRKYQPHDQTADVDNDHPEPPIFPLKVIQSDASPRSEHIKNSLIFPSTAQTFDVASGVDSKALASSVEPSASDTLFEEMLQQQGVGEDEEDAF